MMSSVFSEILETFRRGSLKVMPRGKVLRAFKTSVRIIIILLLS